MSEYAGYERDLDYSEAVLLALMRIAPGETKSIRQIHKCVISLGVHSRSFTPQTTVTIEMIDWVFRNVPAYFPSYEIVLDVVGSARVTHHAR